VDKKEHLIKKLRSFARKVSKDIELRNLIFFGSMATGNAHKDSDIDLLIVSPDYRKKRFWKRSIGLYKYWNLDYPVDFLCLTPEEFEKKRKGVTIVRDAVKEGIDIA
jgi:uncharacterized protein